jgi:pimeloyl-ACP methyl ester carboxylesterase
MSGDPDIVLSGFSDETVEVSGCAVHLLRGGAGPPLVYLHGGGAAGLWRRFHALLAERFEVYAPDHPGFGASEERADLADVAGLASHYLDLTDGLELERALLVGASFGGRVACELALRAPERFSQLVLLAPVGLERIRPSGDVAPRLGSIALQTLLIWGDDDRIVPPAHGERFAELLPDARLHTIRDCGHGLPFEAPEAIADAIAAFDKRGGTS